MSIKLHHTARTGRSAVLRFVIFSSVFTALLAFNARASETSALINKQLDTQQNLTLDTTLPEALQKITEQTGVRLEADPAIWELLPWGEQTNIKANVQNRTLRQGLTAITRHLGLQFSLADESIRITPMPALRRLGQRANLDELGVLALLNDTQLNLDHPTVKQIVSAVNDKLSSLKSPFAIDDRAADAVQDQRINIAPNATLTDLLEAVTQQTNATWYPWGKSILIVSKQEQVRAMLGKTISARYNGVDVGQVLLELFQRAGVDFTVDPGAYEKISDKARSIQLLLDSASIQQALESISGYTGLSFDVTDKGVHVTFPADASASRPAAK